MAAWAWYSPSWSWARAACRMATPSAMSSVSHWLPVLLGEWHDRAVRSRAAAVAGVVQQHQGEQTVDLGVAGQRRQLPGESDGLGREVDVTGVALVEHEVQHSHHGSHLARTIDTGPADRALGPADPLRHGALGHEVGLRDLAGGEAADRPEREGDRR